LIVMDTPILYQGTEARLQPRVLIVEDIAPVATAVEAALRAVGMETERAGNGAEAIERKARFRPDIVLLDLQLPDVSGFSLVERFAHDGDCGIIVVTANSDETLRVEGLDRGADDYLVKPVPMRELGARIRALFRRLSRTEPRDTAASSTAQISTQIVVESAHRCLIGRQGERTLLSEAEFTALETLLDADGAPVSREWLGRVALKRPLHADDRSVDQLVLKLRRKLTASGAAERTILSARRQGYVIPDPTLFRLASPTMVPRPTAGDYGSLQPLDES
jgi:two-component system OmpR family response regulator